MPGSWGQRPWSRDHEGGKREVFWERGSLLLVNNLVFLQKQENSQMSFRGQFQHLIVSLLTFLLMNVNRAVDKSFVFLECSL